VHQVFLDIDGTPIPRLSSQRAYEHLVTQPQCHFGFNPLDSQKISTPALSGHTDAGPTLNE